MNQLGDQRSQQSGDGVGGCVSTVDSAGLTIWIADAHRDEGKRFVVRLPMNWADCRFWDCTGDTRVRGEFDLVVAAQKRVRMKS